MIYFATTRDNERTIRVYLEGHGAPLAQHITPLWYEQLLVADAWPTGTWCFADLELLSDAERETAARIWQDLSARGCRLLNHPTRSLRRYDLLRMLHAQGSNRFCVHRPRDLAAPIRFPVFLRGENDHLGRRTALLRDRAELLAAIDDLERSGERRDGQLITEFCDTRDPAGVYRKYSAFYVAGEVLPKHLFFERDWHVKKARLINEGFLREEREYLTGNPHEKRLREIFSAARIDYGRIDYAVLEGEIQVWEINTNPVITISQRRIARNTGVARWFNRLTGRHRERAQTGGRAQVHGEFATRLAAIWQSLDS